MAVKAVIFDCFGVLMISGAKLFIQQHPHHKEAIKELTRQSDLGVISKEDFTEAISHLMNIPAERAANIFYSRMQQNESAIEWAKELKRQGYKIGLLSNIGRGWIEQFVAAEVFFDEVVLSCNVSMLKPNPAIYKLIADRLSLKTSECVMLDDIPENIVGAKKAKMPGIVFIDTEQAQAEFNNIIKAE